VSVAAEDANPPVLMATSVVGFVEEGAIVGARVVDERGNDVKFAVTDMDRDINEAAPEYNFELTTTSFRVEPSDGSLVVSEPDLDRDPPNEAELNFQVIPFHFSTFDFFVSSILNMII